jgi:hypothetical protein
VSTQQPEPAGSLMAAVSRCAECGDNWLDFCLECEADFRRERPSADGNGKHQSQEITLVDALASKAKVQTR